MAKAKTMYVCSQCGHDTAKWNGQCPACGEWNTLEEIPVLTAQRGGSSTRARKSAQPQCISDIELDKGTEYESTGIAELDRVLGGGLVPGGVVLVGGEPGVGKSTLLLQACEHLAARGRNVLYASGEESARQIKMRAQRLGALSDNLLVLAETDMDAIAGQILLLDNPVVVIDSIQTMFRQDVASAPGNVVQVRECASLALRTAKESGASLVLVGHVTKEGALAGPRVLEHMVDTVLYFEGERHSSYRILRGVKNRFGSTNEIGVFEMTQAGMKEIANPSELLISQRTQGIAGSSVTCSMEGTRPVLCEVQALAATTTFGQPRRMSTGIDSNRALLMIAVLEKRAGLKLYDKDIYLNAAGGLRLSEPASDLAVMAAIASAATNRVIREGFALIGEVGLTGEIRPVSQLERRINECAKMGIRTIVAPAESLAGLAKQDGVEVIGAENILGALAKSLQEKAGK